MPALGSSAERGYGRPHRRIRAVLIGTAPGSPCTRCGEELTADDDVHLDHLDDRSGYAGWAHASCNLRAGAVKGNRARGIGPLGNRSRAW